MSIYVKTPDRWEPLVEGSLGGAPGFPIILNPAGGSVVSFEAGTEGSAGPTIAYGAYITPNDGAIVEVDQETLEATVSGTEPFVNYVVSIYGVNAAGKGEPASTRPFQLNYNSANGGTETIIDDFLGTGEQWIQHTFTANSTFVLTSAPNQIKVRLIGKGGDSGYADCPMNGGGSGGGGGGYEWNDSLAAGEYAVSVGTGNSRANTNAAGSTVEGVGTCGGGGNGLRQAYNSDTGPGQAGTWGGTSNGAAGGGNQYNSSGFTTLWDGQSGAWGYGADARAPSQCGSNQPAQNGIVAIAYQIGVSSTTQIKNAQAKRAARSQGHDVGYAEGFSEGYADFELPTYPDEDTE